MPPLNRWWPAAALLLAGCGMLEPPPAPDAGTALLAGYHAARTGTPLAGALPAGAPRADALPADRPPTPGSGPDAALAARIGRALAQLDAGGHAAARAALGTCDGTQPGINGLCLLLGRLLDDIAAGEARIRVLDQEKGELRARLDRLDAELAAPRALAAEARIATLESRMARQSGELERLRAQLDELAGIERSLGTRYQQAEPAAPAVDEPATDMP
jgi:hypothetical protein